VTSTSSTRAGYDAEFLDDLLALLPGPVFGFLARFASGEIDEIGHVYERAVRRLTQDVAVERHEGRNHGTPG
jgi:hypothetical protein